MENEISSQEFYNNFNRGNNNYSSICQIGCKREGTEKIYFIILGIIAVEIGLFIRGLFEAIGLIFYGYIKSDLPFWVLFSILIFTYLNLKGSRHFS